MSLWSKVAWVVRFLDRHMLVGAIVTAFAISLARGWLSGGAWFTLGCAGALCILLLVRIFRIKAFFSYLHSGKPQEWSDYLQLELLLLCAVYLLISISGGMESPLYPLLFIILCASSALDDRLRNSLVLMALAGGFEIAQWLAGKQIIDGTFVSHLLAIASFPILLRVLMSAFTKKKRAELSAWLEQERRNAELEAREYRLTAAAHRSVDTGTARSPEECHESLQRGSVKQLGIGVGNLLEVAEAALRPQTVALYWLSEDGQTVKLRSARPEGGLLLVESIPAGKGLIGSILTKKGTVSYYAREYNPDLVPYYSGRVAIKTFMGVPLLEGEQGYPRGVLIADRKQDVPFGDDDERVLNFTAREILRVIEAERLLIGMDAVKNENERLYEASDKLNQALSLNEVVKAVLASVRLIYREEVDLAALALVEDGGRKLIIVGVEALGELCALAIKTGLIQPPRDSDQSREQLQVFGKQLPVPGLRAVKVFPLKVASLKANSSNTGDEHAIGALVVGSKNATAFQHKRAMIEMLATVSNMAATSIQNAQRYEQIERMATTDGLTGLYNHRRFQELIDEAVTMAVRYQRPLSLILADVDYFKKINDSFGHPVGDQVLIRVARVLERLARSADRVCRYGGEEFTVIMPETDKNGGCILAERFREEIKRQKFEADGKAYTITISFGVCTLPGYATHKQELIDRADQALYHAKHAGRDRTVHYGDLQTAAGSRSAS
jgi:two-component system cell cycle response regulator